MTFFFKITVTDLNKKGFKKERKEDIQIKYPLFYE